MQSLSSHTCGNFLQKAVGFAKPSVPEVIWNYETPLLSWFLAQQLRFASPKTAASASASISSRRVNLPSAVQPGASMGPTTSTGRLAWLTWLSIQRQQPPQWLSHRARSRLLLGSRLVNPNSFRPQTKPATNPYGFTKWTAFSPSKFVRTYP